MLILYAVPKLVFHIIRYGYKSLVHSIRKTLNKKNIEKNIIESKIAKELIEWTEDPQKVFEQQLKEYSNFSKAVRTAIIEAVIGLILIWWLYPFFPEISNWLIALFTIITIFIVAALALLLFKSSIKDANKASSNASNQITLD